MDWLAAQQAGLKKYESDRPCPHGHGDVRYVSNNGYVECSKIAARTRPKPKVILPIDQLPRDRKTALAMGSKHFYTGEPCRHGHVAKRNTRDSGCTACVRQASDRARNGQLVFRRLVHKADVAPLEALYQALCMARKLG